MKKSDAVKALDQLQDCLYRAEHGKKDLDLLVALRVLYKVMEDLVRHGTVAVDDGKGIE